MQTPRRTGAVRWCMDDGHSRARSDLTQRAERVWNPDTP